ncbi:hypothetical protein [Arthrobacter parietis]|uniref:hypothetical protein n=1 Tax=Arthrobacter parietis TaxID=271434 RepID=UPI0031F81868
MKVILSGLTAAGKTTHTRLLATELRIDALHTTDLLLSALGQSVEDGHTWLRRLKEVEHSRDRDQSADDLVDAALSACLASGQDCVIDSWALPWRSGSETLNIWIGSDRYSRAVKCRVSHLQEKVLAIDEAMSHVDEKDTLTRHRFVHRYGFDIFADRAPFQVVMDNSHLIIHPTPADAETGIKIFHDALVAVVKAWRDSTPTALDSFLRTASDQSRACVVNLSQSYLAAINWPGCVDAAPLMVPVRII